MGWRSAAALVLANMIGPLSLQLDLQNGLTTAVKLLVVLALGLAGAPLAMP
jgi:hypothetical protein